MPRRACNHWRRLLAPIDTSGALNEGVHQTGCRWRNWWERTQQRTFDPALLRHEDLRDWRLARQRDDGAAPATINRGLASLRGYCRWALTHHVLLENPMTDVKDVPTESLSPRSLPAEAVDA